MMADQVSGGGSFTADAAAAALARIIMALSARAAFDSLKLMPASLLKS